MADLKFAIWESWADTFEQMTDESVAALFRAMYRFAFNDEEPQFEPGTPESLVWPMVVESVSRSVKITKRNQENGAKNTGSTQAKPKPKPNTQPKSKPSAKPTAKPSVNPTENLGEPSQTPEKKRKEEKRKEGNGIEKPEVFNSIPLAATVGADADKSAPPSAAGDDPPTSVPVCPLCSKRVRFDAKQMAWFCELCGSIKEPRYVEVEEVAP